MQILRVIFELSGCQFDEQLCARLSWHTDKVLRATRCGGELGSIDAGLVRVDQFEQI